MRNRVCPQNVRVRNLRRDISQSRNGGPQWNSTKSASRAVSQEGKTNMNTDPTIEERQRQGLELSVWGLKKAVLSKRQEVVDLELQVIQAEDELRRFNRKRREEQQ
jgi:hypothetical protein